MLAERRVWHEAMLPPMDVPGRFAAGTPADIPFEAVRECVERYTTVETFWDAANRGIAPAFVGRVGTWKTYAAWLVARFARWQKLPTMFVECGPFFMELDAAFYSPGGLKPYRRAAEVPFLVLDDFTQVKPGSRGVEIMSNLVVERFSALLPTVFTGNQRVETKEDLKSLAKDYRPDFVRRLRHGAAGFFVSVG